jgi:hypothetical protein
MGRQIGFYFDDIDEKEFLKLSQLQDIVFLRFREMKCPECEEVDIVKYSRTSYDQTQIMICEKDDSKNVAFLEGGGTYMIDNHDSPVIEFSRSGYLPRKNLLVSGRLWYQHKYWTKDENGDDIIKEKSKELERLYNSLARWIRKHCTRLPNGNYIASHAMELHRSGAELSP